MRKIQILLNKSIEKENLNLEDSMSLMTQILQGNLTNAQVVVILIALRMKGESEEEILGFIRVMRKYMEKIKTSGIVVDTCGTGGDGKGTFNISTAVSLVVAGAGVGVAKHGNRSASSLCGSADVLEALGVNIHLTPKQAEACLEKVGMTFLFAPLFHPSMKHVAPVRKELGIRTVFNYLGPFVNPASVKRQIIGVPDKKIAEKLVKVASKLHYEHLLIVTSEDELDEISIFAETHIFEIKKKKITYKTINLKSLNGQKYSLNNIKGGDAPFNAKIIGEILDGKRGARRDIVIANSAAALYVAGKVKNIEGGIPLAQKSIDSGKAKEVLQKLITETQHYA